MLYESYEHKRAYDSLLCAALGILALALLVVSFIYGAQKQLDINDRTYYDAEFGRTMYREEGV